jgi:very-short-patch-repair endonuclease
MRTLLKNNNIEYIEEFYDEFFIDFAIKKENIAIELDGMQHFTSP